MKKNFTQMLLVISMCTLCLAFVTSSLSGATLRDRASEEKAIRAVLFEMSIANQTGNAKLFRMHAAQRTLRFYDILVEELINKTTLGKQPQAEGVTNGETYMEYSFHMIAERAATKSDHRRLAQMTTL